MRIYVLYIYYLAKEETASRSSSVLRKMMLGQLKDSHKSCSLPEAAVHVELAWKRILASQEQTIDQALAFMFFLPGEYQLDR